MGDLPLFNFSKDLHMTTFNEIWKCKGNKDKKYLKMEE